MQYEDYKTASERHLETCLKLKEVVTNNYLNRTLSATELKKQNEILANIYYLTGYVIECIVSYGILKYIDIENIYRSKGITKLKQLNSFYSPQKVSYDYNDQYCRWSIINPKHSIEKNLTFFTLEARLTGLNIRGIDKNIDGNLNKLIKNWNAEYRYYLKDNTVLDYNKIFPFLALAEEIHYGIRTKITND